jgi:hypothetical protein
MIMKSTDQPADLELIGPVSPEIGRHKIKIDE